MMLDPKERRGLEALLHLCGGPGDQPIDVRIDDGMRQLLLRVLRAALGTQPTAPLRGEHALGWDARALGAGLPIAIGQSGVRLVMVGPYDGLPRIEAQFTDEDSAVAFARKENQHALARTGSQYRAAYVYAQGCIVAPRDISEIVKAWQEPTALR